MRQLMQVRNVNRDPEKRMDDVDDAVEKKKGWVRRFERRRKCFFDERHPRNELLNGSNRS